MQTTKRIRIARIASVLLAIGAILEAYFWGNCFLQNGCSNFFADLQGTAEKIMMYTFGSVQGIGALLSAVSAGLCVGVAWQLWRADTELGRAQARRMNLCSILFTVLARMLNIMYTFAILKNLTAFFNGQIGTLEKNLVIGCIALVLLTVMHLVMLILLWPYKMHKSPMKGVRRFPAVGAAVGAVILIVSFIVNANMFLPVIQARKSITAFQSFEAVSLTGEPVTQEILQDKVTIMNIWETTCGPCKAEMPDLEKVSQAVSGTNVQIIGLCYDIQVSEVLSTPHTIEDAKSILNDRGVTYMNLQASEELNQKILSFVSAFPTTVVLDESGNVLEFFEGSKSEADWMELVQKYLK